MTTEQLTAMRQALIAMDRISDADADCDFLNDSQTAQLLEAITTLRAAIEAETAQGQEPLGYWNAVQGWVDLPEETHKPAAWVYPEFWEHLERGNCGTAYRLPGGGRQPLYTTPTAALKPLTDEQIGMAFRKAFPVGGVVFTNGAIDFARAIEAKLREKNGGKV